MKRRFFLKSISSLLVLMLSLAAVPLCVSAAGSGNTYYVSQESGSDTNSGSASAPFKTIAKAAAVMSAGDTCYIYGGAYRESIALDGKTNLTFKAADSNNRPLLTGTEAVTGWQNESGSIWYADCPAAFTDADFNRVLVFAGGALAEEARWPNTAGRTVSSDEAHPLLQSATYAAITTVNASNSLTINGLPDADLTGGYLWVASTPSYWSNHLDILGKSGNQLTVTSTTAKTAAGDICYIYGCKALMDAEGEWYFDKTAKRLYFYTENASGPQNVEIRSREYALNITNSAGISFDGIDVRGAMVQLGEGSRGCTIQNAVLETLDKAYPTAADRTSHRGSAGGVLLGGTDNLLTGCEVKNMYGRGVSVSGSSNRVINNYIHDINFEHDNFDDGIRLTEGSGHAVYRNTITRTGRSAIGADCTASVISYNYLYDGNRISKDSGLMYFNDNNYENTEVHHNILGESVNNTGMQYGLYLDSFTSGMLVYKNLIYGQETSGNTASRTSVVGPNTIGNLFANNTYINTKTVNGLKGDRSGTVFINNLFVNSWKDTTWDWTTIYESNNATIGSSALAADYTLTADAAAAIDKGIFLNGITTDAIDSAPDCGAFEYGAAKWTAGCDLTNTGYASEKPAVNTGLPFRNLLTNPGFEAVSDSAINSWSGSAETFKQSTWNYFGSLTRNGERAARLSGGGKISQTVTGLKPNTVYEAGGYGAVAGPFYAAWKSGGASSQLTVYDQASGFKDDVTETITYSSFKLDAGYDTIVFGFQQAAGKGSITKSITLKDSGSSTLISCPVSGSGSYNDNGYMWDWVSAAIPVALRGQTLTNVSLVFEGNGFKTYGGYYLYNSQSAESITLSAVSGGYSSTVVLSDSLMPQKRAELEIMTDENGSITFEAAKSAGNMYGYVDEVFLREKFAPEGASAADGEIRGIKITDSEDKLLYGIRPGGEHFISGRLLNTGTTAKAVTLTLTSYAADGTAYASKDKSLSVSAGAAAAFSVSVRAKNQAGAYFTLTASQGAKRTVYTITDADLEAQHTDTARAFLKTAAIYNQSGEILDEAVPGEFNMFHITAANPTGAEQGMQGILAVYNSKDRLIDLTSFKCKLVSGVNKYAIGTILPEEEGVYAKLFTWTNLQELKPLIETASFK